jgi:hypothetical protein
LEVPAPLLAPQPQVPNSQSGLVGEVVGEAVTVVAESVTLQPVTVV